MSRHLVERTFTCDVGPPCGNDKKFRLFFPMDSDRPIGNHELASAIVRLVEEMLGSSPIEFGSGTCRVSVQINTRPEFEA
jgi:hypothetical protein